MKVFYSASISRTTELLPLSKNIVELIEKYGHEVLTKELVDAQYAEDPNLFFKNDADKVYKSAEKRLKEADVLITECTIPSFAGGWWIDKCLAMKKPMLSLHYGSYIKNAPLMIQGREKEINLVMYTEDNLELIIKNFLNNL